MSEPRPIQMNFQQAIQMLQQERASFEALQERMEKYRLNLEETLIVQEALNTVQKLKEDKSVKISLGAGVYMDANLVTTDKVLITLGGAILKPASIPEALKGLENRQKEAEMEIAKISEEQRKHMANINSLTQVARSLGDKNRQ